MCAATCLSYAGADHGGAFRPLQLRAIPGREHPGHSKTSEGGQLGTYGGRDRGGSSEPVEEQVRGGVGDASSAPERVAHSVQKGKLGVR